MAKTAAKLNRARRRVDTQSPNLRPKDYAALRKRCGRAKSNGVQTALSSVRPAQELRIEWRQIDSVRPYSGNPRTHSDKQLKLIGDSILRFGWVVPLIVDANGRLITGHGRLEAAKRRHLMEVPTIRIDHLTDGEQRAYRIADNRLAERADWDTSLLASEFKHLSHLDLDFDLSLTGFETAEIDLLLDPEQKANEEDEADILPAVEFNAPTVSRLGDLWQLGSHRLLCADALRPESYDRLLAGETAQMVFTDPPFNVRIAGHVSGKGRSRHDEFVMASGEMTEAQFTEFLRTAFVQHARFSSDGAIHFICMDWRHIREIMASGLAVYSKLMNLVCWVKDNGGMGSFYRSQHELVFVFKKGSRRHINNFELGQHGRYRTNVWAYAGLNTMKRGRLEQLAMHPTVKPVAMVSDAIKDCSQRNGVVLDGFAGSGTTIIAADKAGRRARCIELDPRYVDVAVKRWEKFTGIKARLTQSGRSFDEVSGERASRAFEPTTAPPAATRRR